MNLSEEELAAVEGMTNEEYKEWYDRGGRPVQPPPTPTVMSMGTPGITDTRDLRDPAVVGQAYLERPGHHETALSNGRPMVGTTDPGRVPPKS